MPHAVISGTTLATVLLISTVGSGAYASLGHLDLDLEWPIALGSVAGAALGALASRRVSTRLMLGVFLVILPYFAIKELWPAFPAPALSASILALASLGFAAGFLSGLLGISGASLVVPSLVAFFMIDQHSAQGIAIFAALADSISGAATHARPGNIRYRTLVYLGPPAVVAAACGALLSDSLSGPVLRNIFVAFMAAVWVALLVRMMRDHVERTGTFAGPDRLRVTSRPGPAPQAPNRSCGTLPKGTDGEKGGYID